MAPMKAGKSTFLNALIGSDILASESAACTVCRTDIRHVQSGEPQLLEYQEGQKNPIILAEGNSTDIVEKFLQRTHQIRETSNEDCVTHFEVLHSIEAISKYSSLAGFKLVDTPGPNEWESATLNTTKLKQIALEAVRTCDAILFLLDYTSFKDEASTGLFKELIENRQDFLSENTGKIYFILNKIDMRTEKDKPIEEVLQMLKLDLERFKFSHPVIYPVSARKGLWSRLIQDGSATKQLKQDFRKFYSGAYAVEDEEGGSYTPPSSQIAPQALQDSKIPFIEEKVMQTIIQNSGWNLLSGVCAKLDKSAKSMEDKLNLEIRGWEMNLKNLEAQVEEYKQSAESAKKKFESVRKAVDKREQELTVRFNAELENFSNMAKLRIEKQFNRFAESRKRKNPIIDPISWVKESIDSFVKAIIPNIFDSFETGSDPNKIQVTNQAEAQKIAKAINSFCGPVIQD
ncbi:MAG: dynamin family protein [Cyanobacteria bacterium P01_F01_bin.143]